MLEAARRGASGMLIGGEGVSLASLAGLDGDDEDAWRALVGRMTDNSTFAEAPFVQLEAEMHGCLVIHIIAEDRRSVVCTRRHVSGAASADVRVQHVVLWNQRYEAVRRVMW